MEINLMIDDETLTAVEKQHIKKITLRLPDRLYEALKVMSDKTGLTIHSLVLLALHLRIGAFRNIAQAHK